MLIYLGLRDTHTILTDFFVLLETVYTTSVKKKNKQKNPTLYMQQLWLKELKRS